VSRIVSGKLRIELRPTALGDVIGAALDTVRPAVEAKGLALEVDLDPACGAVLGDSNRLQQVAWNLLSNAAKFTPPGGQIGVRLARVGDKAELSVRDTGQGIPQDFLPYIFDRFSQADSSSQRTFGGLGLGLAIVRHLVELHGGAVEATSAGAGRGATFIVRLPLAAAGDEAGPGASGMAGEDARGDAAGALRGLRVLVVDDQPVILGLLEEILASEGATVLACVAALDALALLREWRPDVLVSDIAMPDEDGYWLIRQVRSLTPDEGGETPAVALTAYGRVEDRLQLLTAGFQEHVPKPVEPNELRDIVARLASNERER
jgi:CheY-like chemotaxis protein